MSDAKLSSIWIIAWVSDSGLPDISTCRTRDELMDRISTMSALSELRIWRINPDSGSIAEYSPAPSGRLVLKVAE